VFAELCALMLKSMGPADVLFKALTNSGDTLACGGLFSALEGAVRLYPLQFMLACSVFQRFFSFLSLGLSPCGGES